MSTAIITGASRGLGHALARALVARRWNLVIDARGAPALRAVAAELGRQSNVEAISGDVAENAHLEELVRTAQRLGDLSLVVNNASVLGPSPQPHLATYPIDTMNDVFRVNTLAPLGLIQLALPYLSADARIINVTSDAAIEGYEGWGGYGASKAALEQISNVLAAEHPDLRVYWVDPGDMNTEMQQEAFPGEDISDRPSPDASIPGLLTLIEGDLPSGRYRARELVTTGADA